MTEAVNIILTVRTADLRELDTLNALSWRRGERGLVSCDYDKPRSTWYGGSKYLEMGIWIGAFSELDVDALVAAIRQISWDEPECVRLYVCRGNVGFTRIDWQVPEQPSEIKST